MFITAAFETGAAIGCRANDSMPVAKRPCAPGSGWSEQGHHRRVDRGSQVCPVALQGLSQLGGFAGLVEPLEPVVPNAESSMGGFKARY